MLYVLPPPRAPDPPSPWDSIICGNTNSNNNQERSTWSNKTHPPKIRLREFQVPKREDSSSGFAGDDTDAARNPKSLSECYFAGKGTALVLPAAEAQKSSRPTDANGSNIQKHLQSMFYLLRPEETLKMAVKLESVHPTRTRYLVVVSRMGQNAEESCLLGIDCNEKTTVGLVLRVLADTAIRLDGDGGFSVSVCGRHHIFKPVSVQAMWSALQTLHKVSSKACEENYFQGGLTHGWVNYYEERIKSDRSCINEWHAMDNLESRRPPSPDSIRTKPTEREETEKVIRTTLKEIMMSVDLDEVTSKDIRIRLEVELDMNLDEFKSFIDQEMLTILGQMDAPTEIFDHVYLGSEWNASNYEELQRNGVGHILNVTREIDNFFPGTFNYLNIRVYDDEKTDLLKHWDNTYKYITKARNAGSKVLVHCKMGVSRSASVVIAYAMKAYDWDFQRALKHVKEKRNCIKPNSSFISQLETYQGILDAMKNKEKLQRSKSETNLKAPVQAKNDTTRTGNDPPPISEQLAANVDASSSGQDLRQIGVRPKSWSPDISASITDSQNVFLSLENLNQRSVSKDSLKSLRQKCLEKNQAANLQNRNVLLPCDNGESYSVSPNQIRHLPGQHYDNEHTSVKDRINELEAQKLQKSISKKKLILNVSSKVDGEIKDTTTKVSEDCALLDSSSKSGGTGPVHEEPNKKLSPLARRAVKNETWDPGEQNTTNNCAKDNVCDYKLNSISDKQTECSSSATLKLRASLNDKVPDINCAKSKTLPSKNGDPFSNQLDRVFDREERKQQRMSYPILPTNDYVHEEFLRDCPSRQNSWSSYDSAVVLGYQGETRDTPSRHSSWGSGDTRALASRNSSFGSYDMRQSGSTGHVNEKGEKTMITSDVELNTSGIFPYDREDIPWYPGTVKRTRQKLEECAGKKVNEQTDFNASDLLDAKDKSNSSDTLTSDYPSSIISQNEQNVEAFNTTLIKLQNPNSVVGRVASIPSAISVKPTNKLISGLSVSAPETSTMELIPKECSLLSRSVSNVSTIGKDIANQTQHFSNVKKYRTVLESLTKTNVSSKKSSPEEQNSNISGIVRSRKKEFEAKTVNSNERLCQSNSADVHNKNRVNSLPSSPINMHVDKELKEVSSSSDPGEDPKLRKLIGKFENGNTDKNYSDFQVNLRPKQNKSFFLKNNRNSYVDVTFDKKNCITPPTTTTTPIISSFNNKCNTVNNHDNKNVLNNDSKNFESDLKRPPVGPVVRNTQPNVVATKSNKKQLQYGKTHPLARLNTKPRHNNPVYNTM